MECELRANLQRLGRLEWYATHQRHAVDGASEGDHTLHVELYGHRRVDVPIGRGGRDQTGAFDRAGSLTDDDYQHGLLYPDLECE
jgi:hypothetical protein